MVPSKYSKNLAKIAVVLFWPKKVDDLRESTWSMGNPAYESPCIGFAQVHAITTRRATNCIVCKWTVQINADYRPVRGIKSMVSLWSEQI